MTDGDHQLTHVRRRVPDYSGGRRAGGFEFELKGGKVALWVARHDACARHTAVAEFDGRLIAWDDMRVRDDESRAFRLSRVPQDPRAGRRTARSHLHGDMAQLLYDRRDLLGETRGHAGGRRHAARDVGRSPGVTCSVFTCPPRITRAAMGRPTRSPPSCARTSVGSLTGVPSSSSSTSPSSRPSRSAGPPDSRLTMSKATSLLSSTLRASDAGTRTGCVPIPR